jgi:uncharacterized protein (DUF433 family)
MNWKDRIETNPEGLAGKPVGSGTRIPVELVVERTDPCRCHPGDLGTRTTRSPTHAKKEKCTFARIGVAEDWSVYEIPDQYPAPSREAVQACLRYAHERLRAERVYPRTTGSTA